ncbi:MAG: COG1361 S-layer family protein, partial [Candidatus Heimdallarchaeaceae archaeon]
MKYKFILVFLVCSLTALPVHALISPDIDIVLTKQNPYPVSPGDNVNVEIELQNNGYADAENIK